jgi:hypothetical protein
MLTTPDNHIRIPDGGVFIEIPQTIPDLLHTDRSLDG